MSVIVGIDLGTTRSSIAIMDGDKPVLIPIHGLTLVPSVVACANNGKGEILVGEAARRQALINPQHTIVAVKKLMGKGFKDVEPILDFFPYKILAGENDVPNVFMGDKAYSPQEISAFILRHLKEGAEAYLGQPVEECVLTVPANFDSTEWEATREACEMAGLKLIRFLREPTAACFAFGFTQRAQGHESMIAVFDLGGSSTDVSIVEMGGGVFEVKATVGDNFLGGVDFDYAIANSLIAKFKAQQGIDLQGDPVVWHRMMDAAEKAKIELSTTEETTVFLPFVSVNSQIRDLQIGFTRDELELVCKPLLDRCLDLCKIIKNTHAWLTIEELVLVGSATRMPRLRELLAAFFDKTPVPTVNPEEIVALGAAVQGGILQGLLYDGLGPVDILLLDAVAHELGILIPSDCIQKNAEILEQDISESLVEQRIVFIEADSIIPAKKTRTIIPGKEHLTFSVFENKDGNPKILRRITLELTDFDAETPGYINFTFDIDANGRLDVSVIYDQREVSYQEMYTVGAFSTAIVQVDHISLEKRYMQYRFAIRATTGLQRDVINNARLNASEKQYLNEQKKQLDTYRSQIQPDQVFRMERLLESLEFWVKAGAKDKIEPIQHEMQQKWQSITQQRFLGIEPDPAMQINGNEYRQELFGLVKQLIVPLLDTPEGLLQVQEKLAAGFGQTEIILLLSRYRQSMKDYHQGQLTKAEYDVEVNRMRKSMLFHFEESGKQPDYDWRYFHTMQLLLETISLSTPKTA